MLRTNIYLSEAEQRALDAQAAAEGTTRSAILRRIIDRELHLDGGSETDELIGDLAAELAEIARADSVGDPDLAIE